MGLFSTSTPFDEALDKLTNEMNTEVDWGAILALCDKIKVTQKGFTDFATIIIPRISHKVPHVSMQAITILDACVNNCGKDFHKVVSSTQFTYGLREILYNYKNQKVTRRLKYFIKKWAEDFKEDSQLSHFVSFYYELRSEGVEFPDTESDSPAKKKPEISRNPDAVSSQQEADDIAKAIEASLKEDQQRRVTLSSYTAPSSSLYPSMSGGATSTSTSHSTSSSRRKVKALYDFEAAEDNELTFKTGDIITITDDSDPNWWKGEDSNGSGLFPSNFVTSDLSKDVEEEEVHKEPVVTFNETLEIKEVNQDQPVLSINENIIDRTLAALQSTDPETTTSDPEELLRDEDSCIQMGKLIDNKLEDIDRKHLELSVLNEKILESLKMYDKLMNQPPVSAYNPQRYSAPPSQVPPQMMGGYPPTMSYPPAPYNQGQPGPSAAPPGHMPQSTAQAYNPMYQAPPAGGYPAAASGNMTSMEQQPPAMQQPDTGFQVGVPQQTDSRITFPQPVGGYHGNAPVMSQYQNQGHGLAATPTTSNYSTNQVATQPLM